MGVKWGNHTVGIGLGVGVEGLQQVLKLVLKHGSGSGSD
jgi:hypothetical protein